MRGFLITLTILLLTGCRSLTKSAGDKTAAGDSEQSWGDRSEGDYYYEDYQRRKREQAEREARAKAQAEGKTSNPDSDSALTEEEKIRRAQAGQTDTESDSTGETTTGKDNKPADPDTKETGPDGLAKGDKGGMGDNERTGSENITKKEEESRAAAYAAALSAEVRIRKDKETQSYLATNRLKIEGLMTEADLKALAKVYAKPVIIQRPMGKEELGLYAGNKDNRIFETIQFTMTKGNRLRSYQTLNGPGKDYHLVQSPVPGSRKYYFLSDRPFARVKDTDNAKEKPIESLRSEFDPAIFEQIIKAEAAPSVQKGTGFLEILVCESAENKDGNKEIFYNPRFISLQTKRRGHKLGFTLFYNSSTKELELIYAVEGDLYRAVSKDGENFTNDALMQGVSGDYLERDPSVSPDGRTLVFASARNFRSNILGTQLFVAYRESLDEDFSDPAAIPDAINSLGELFPSIFTSSRGTFIFFKKYDKGSSGYAENFYSVEVRNGVVLPMVPFAAGSQIPHKYITISYSEKRGYRVMSSYPDNDYDIYRMQLSSIQPVKVNSAGVVQ